MHAAGRGVIAHGTQARAWPRPGARGPSSSRHARAGSPSPHRCAARRDTLQCQKHQRRRPWDRFGRLAEHDAVAVVRAARVERAVEQEPQSFVERAGDSPARRPQSARHAHAVGSTHENVPPPTASRRARRSISSMSATSGSDLIARPLSRSRRPAASFVLLGLPAAGSGDEQRQAPSATPPADGRAAVAAVRLAAPSSAVASPGNLPARLPGRFIRQGQEREARRFEVPRLSGQVAPAAVGGRELDQSIAERFQLRASAIARLVRWCRTENSCKHRTRLPNVEHDRSGRERCAGGPFRLLQRH